MTQFFFKNFINLINELFTLINEIFYFINIFLNLSFIKKIQRFYFIFFNVTLDRPPVKIYRDVITSR